VSVAAGAGWCVTTARGFNDRLRPLACALLRRFDAAVKIINSIISPKLPVLLEQIAARTAAFSDPDGDGDAGKLFSAEQEASLSAMLEIDADGLGTVLRAAVYIFETAGFAGAKPAILADELVGAGVDVDRAGAFHSAWASQGAAVIAGMRSRTLGGPSELVSSAFQVHQSVGTPGATLLRDASSVLELRVRGMASRPGMDLEAAGGDSTAASAAAASAARAAAAAADDDDDQRMTDTSGVRGVGDRRVRLELSREGLLELLERLDGVQKALDGLSA